MVLTGNGKAFCAGGDIAGMKERRKAPSGQVAFNGWRRQGQTHKSVALLHDLPKPTIAAVNGAASGLGCDTALACDFIIATERRASRWLVQRGSFRTAAACTSCRAGSDCRGPRN